MSVSRLFCASLVAAASAVSCGGSSSDVPAPVPSPAPAPVPTPSSTQATATIGAGGGQVELSGVAKASIPAGALASDTTLTVATDASEEEADTFSANVNSIGVSDADPVAVRISIGTQDWSNETLQVKFQLSNELMQLASAGRTLAVFAAGTDVADDPDKGEEHDVYDPIVAVVDVSSNTLTATIPSTAFAAYGQGVAALLRVGAYAAEYTGSTALARPQAGVFAADNQCPGDASFKAPMIYGWRKDATPLTYYDGEVGGVVGPFAEPRPKSDPKLKNDPHGHQGMDLFADEGTPVLAVADGYVTYVGDEKYACPISATKKRTAPTLRAEKKQIQFPEFRLTLAVTNGSGKVTDLVTYRHLTPNSVTIRGVKEDTFAKCWQDNGTRKYRVTAGDQIALTGKSGTCNGQQCPPHLHFEWVPISSGKVGNPLCKLATVYAGRILGPPTDPNAVDFSYKLYGWPAPGTLYPNGFAITNMEFWVRRNKVDARYSLAPRICRSGEKKSAECDRAGKGFFTYPMFQAAWPRESDGEMAQQEFVSSSPRVAMVMKSNFPGTFDQDWPWPHITPWPDATFYQSEFRFDGNPPCDLNVDYTYKISVFWDRFRKTRKTFGLYDKGTVTTTPLPPPIIGCQLTIK